MLQIAKYLKNLKSLNITQNVKINDEGIICIIQNCRKLKKLRAGLNRQVSIVFENLSYLYVKLFSMKVLTDGCRMHLNQYIVFPMKVIVKGLKFLVICAIS